ncbi:helix-turn-helix domain protein [Acinetobacter sp. 1475718]|jgi:IS30 family transposase|nr:helix-turn-helix domain protein [Acinetobacter sp. 1475718]
MEYIKLSYHHLNFEDRTALMLESRKEGFSARKFAELIKRHPSTIYRELKRNSINDVYQARYASDNTSLDVDVVTENSKSIQSSGNLLLKRSVVYGLLSK